MPDRRIQYLDSRDIDREKWDQCVQHAPNGLIYNTSIYLDMMADHWNGVIVGDYEAVMPLPWRKKWFVKYHYHVPFIAQNGISGEIGYKLSAALARLIFRKIRYGDLLLNFGNETFAKQVHAVALPNLILNLSVEYPHLHKDYRRDLEKNLARASRFKMEYREENDVKLPVHLFKKLYATRLVSVREIDYERFTGLCLYLQKMQMAFVRKVVDGSGKLLAIALMLKDQNRIYNIINAVPGEGRRRSANHYLFDQLIREFAGSGLLLDFEGSQRQGIRRFYENFGAINEPYYWVRRRPF